MANVEKIVCTWNGLPGGVGNTVLYWQAGAYPGAQPAVKTFFQGMAPFMPPSVSVTVPTTGEVLDETTGKMNNVWSTGSVLTIAGTATATAYTPQAGALVQWNTAGFTNGRHVRGRTFIVPLSAGVYTSSGLLTASNATTMTGVATSFIANTGNSLVVWHRPVYSKPPNSTLTRPGAMFVVTTGLVPTKTATLKGRRDT